MNNCCQSPENTAGYRLPEGNNLWVPVSGGGDSAALAIILKERFPTAPFRYIFTDTKAEPPDTYETLDKLESWLGRPIIRLEPEKGLFELLDQYNGYLPSAQSRWCTRKIKLTTWENFVRKQDTGGEPVHSFIGIRADESTRLAFTSDLIETHLPFVEMGITREDVFRTLDRTIGIPSIYRYKTRSGCSVCPFQRRSEFVGLLQYHPKEFARGQAYEKLSDTDRQRHPDNARKIGDQIGWGGNWMTYPVPPRIDARTAATAPAVVWGKRQRDNGTLPLFGPEKAGLYVGVEFLVNPGVGGTGVWMQRLVSISSSLAGIRRQLDAHFIHRLNTAEVDGIGQEEMREEIRLAVYFIEVDKALMDVRGIEEGYTWRQGESLQQLRHLVGWAQRSLHAAGLRQQENEYLQYEEDSLSWGYEQLQATRAALTRLDGETGELIACDLYEPKVRTEEDLEIDERLIPCPMCHI